MDKKATGLLLALSLSLIVCLPLLAGGGPVNTRGGGDSPFLLVRLHQLVSNLSAGVFPARWMPDAAYGLGYPFFNFYASLPYYIAALFKLWGFGFIWAIKLTQLLGFVAAAASMYLLAKHLFQREASAILAALAYTYAPYHLVNVYVRGDALSEFYAFVFYPLIFWALLRLRSSLSNNQFSPRITRISLIYPLAGNIALLALAYGGLILTHNVSALIFSAFMLLYILLTSSFQPPTSKWLASSALGLGLAISAWYWIPALLEGNYVQLQHQTTGYLNYSNHFRGLDLVQPSLPRTDTLRHGAGTGRARPPGCGSHRRLVDQAPPPRGPERVLHRWPGTGYLFHHPALAPPVGQRAAAALRAISLAFSVAASLLRQPGHRLFASALAQAALAGLRRGGGVGGGCHAGPEA